MTAAPHHMTTSHTVCVDLATTGQPLNALLVIGLGCLLAGLVLLLAVRVRHGRTVTATVLMILVLLAGPATVDGGTSTAAAAGPDCVTTAAPPPPMPSGPDPATSPLAIGQVSTMTGLAPGAGPTPIVGRIVNNGPVELYVTDVTVSIVSVTKKPSAAPGACDASDYLLQAVRMPVAVLIPPGGSTLFSGASIEFNNKLSTNQDPCQGAIVGLQYIST